MDRAHDRRSWARSTLIYTDSDTPSPSCLTRARVRTRPSRAAYSARDFVRIALAGKAAKEEFLRRQTSAHQRLIPNPDGANDDLKSANATLASMDIEDEYEQLWREVTELVERKWTSIERVAALIFSSQHNEISRAAVLQTLSES
jgi:hypothetical protein